ncbi:MAG TPA: hypothetical protein PK159_08970 [Steroidobacteraceae bacterium]|nr:hypothetical protein [Steroidobacteraceae bacterium]
MRSTWRMILVTVFLSLLVMAASFAALRATAQDVPPPADPAAAPAPAEDAQPAEPAATADDATPDDDVVAPADEPPDLKMSADSTISFPVDI